MGRELGFITSLLILLFAGAAQSSVLNCATSQDSCGFYRCMESQKHCGSNGYPLAFGDRLCERYRQVQNHSSYALRKWYPRVRECLQQVVAEIADPLSCEDLETKAFESHLDCYMETGFCDLSFADKLTVLRVAGLDALYPKTMEVSLKVAATCEEWNSASDTERLMLVQKAHVDIDNLVDDAHADQAKH